VTVVPEPETVRETALPRSYSMVVTEPPASVMRTGCPFSLKAVSVVAPRGATAVVFLFWRSKV
jgi:hypothetical protein